MNPKINWGHLMAIIIGWVIFLYCLLWMLTSCSTKHSLVKSQNNIKKTTGFKTSYSIMSKRLYN